MRDFEIRRLLHEHMQHAHRKQRRTRIVDELALPGVGARVDVAVVNGSLHGYEIKGASDTLQRLPGQISGYQLVMDYVTIVTEQKHLHHVLSGTPEWVGVALIQDSEKPQKLKTIRQSSLNTLSDPLYIAKLLWRDELIAILRKENIPFKQKFNVWDLCRRLIEYRDKEGVSKLVRDALKKRTDWKIKKATEAPAS